jgi:hypothetical protein
MGIDPSSFQLENIDCLKDLEIARHHIDQKLQENANIRTESNPHSPCYLDLVSLIQIQMVSPCLVKKLKEKD